LAHARLHRRRHVDALYIFRLLLSALMCATIFTMILVFALKYRCRRGIQVEQIEGSTALEVTWSVIPFGIFPVIFVRSATI
jgi:cytochrome c oxidase subunit 2